MENIPPPSKGIAFLLQKLAEAQHLNAWLVDQADALARENAELKAKLEPKGEEPT